jgi:hypothetical protein
MNNEKGNILSKPALTSIHLYNCLQTAAKAYLFGIRFKEIRKVDQLMQKRYASSQEL